MAKHNSICTVVDCGKQARTKGFCNAHHLRWLRHGDPLGGSTKHGAPLEFLDKATHFPGGECLLWPFARNSNGYPQIWIDGEERYAHRVVCERVHGPAPSPEHEAAHKCGKGGEGCISPLHLEWKTHAENTDDTLVHGTRSRGERHGMAKLTADEVQQIRSNGRKNTVELADEFGVNHSHVSAIKKRKSWAWLE